MSNRKIHLVIGASSFIGRHLVRSLDQKGSRIVGTYFRSKPRTNISQRTRFVRCNVCNSRAVKRLIQRIRPAVVYYLSSQSSARKAWTDPTETFQVNLFGGLNVLEAMRKLKSKACLVVFSSVMTYAVSHLRTRGFREDDALHPKDPYGVSKVAIDSLTRMYARVYGLDTRVVRLSNLMGQGQSRDFSVSNFACQIARIEQGKQRPVMRVGNLAAKRDFLDVKDGVSAVLRVVRQGKRGEVYNIGSGQSRSLKSILKDMLRLSKLNPRSVRIVRKRSLISKDEVKEIKLSISKLIRHTGWKPRIRFKDSLSDLLLEWRGRRT